MTAKQLLYRKIERMSDEDAQLALELLATDEDFDLPPLTTNEKEAIDRALEQGKQGRVVPHEDVVHRFGRT